MLTLNWTTLLEEGVFGDLDVFGPRFVFVALAASGLVEGVKLVIDRVLGRRRRKATPALNLLLLPTLMPLFGGLLALVFHPDSLEADGWPAQLVWGAVSGALGSGLFVITKRAIRQFVIHRARLWSSSKCTDADLDDDEFEDDADECGSDEDGGRS